LFKGHKKTRVTLLVLLIVLSGAGAYWAGMLALSRNPVLNFDVVEEGKLFRSGQPETGDLDRIRDKYGLETIFCLRGRERSAVKDWSQKNEVRVISIAMKADDPPTADQIGLFFDIMRGSTVDLVHYQPIITQSLGFSPTEPVRFEFPVLIHCEGGADRTGIMVALYRIAFQDWTLEQARWEMRRRFHLPHRHPAQLKFLEKIAPALHPAYGGKAGQEE